MVTGSIFICLTLHLLIIQRPYIFLGLIDSFGVVQLIFEKNNESLVCVLQSIHFMK